MNKSLRHLKYEEVQSIFEGMKGILKKDGDKYGIKFEEHKEFMHDAGYLHKEDWFKIETPNRNRQWLRFCDLWGNKGFYVIIDGSNKHAQMFLEIPMGRNLVEDDIVKIFVRPGKKDGKSYALLQDMEFEFREFDKLQVETLRAAFKAIGGQMGIKTGFEFVAAPIDSMPDAFLKMICRVSRFQKPED